LSFQARHNGQNYVFALLTGYHDPPAGVAVILIPFSLYEHLSYGKYGKLAV
jgi:hypothetical protein